MDKLKVLIAAGGSGGHLFPAQQLREKLSSDAEVAFAGYRLSESPFFAREDISFAEIVASPLKRGFVSKSWKGFWQAIHFLCSFRPDVVVGFGSFHIFPVLLAAVFLRKKIVLFEANCVLGKVNWLFSPFAKSIAGQFLKPLVSLLPWADQKVVSQEEARRYFQLCPNTFTILIFGGSQGASFFNEIMPAVCAQLSGVQVIHLYGKGKAVHTVPACVKPFEKEMVQAYAAADVAICRAGAATIAELIRFAVPALCIPYPYAAENHQEKNGEFFSQKIGGGRMLLQQEATVEKIVEEVELLKKRREEHRKALLEYGLQNKKRVGLEELVKTVGKKR